MEADPSKELVGLRLWESLVIRVNLSIDAQQRLVYNIGNMVYISSMNSSSQLRLATSDQ